MAISEIDKPFELPLPCIKISQPMGDFFVASIGYQQLIQITYSDIRRLIERPVDTYMGIQREVDPRRVKDLQRYVNTVDACFPTAVILAVDGRCAEFDEDTRTLTLRSFHDDEGRVLINRIGIAKVLDGQHRIEGLKSRSEGKFDINVSIFVDMDIADQAHLFSVVNLAQTKVKKSLVYDLFDYARTRSPQKSAHNIAIALDQVVDGPFHRRIKRLGSATPGRVGETLTQAAFVESLLEHLTSDAVADREIYKKGGRPSSPTKEEVSLRVFRSMFLEDRDMEIADIVLNFYTAVMRRWPRAWSGVDGLMLGRSGGFRGLMRLLGPLYRKLAPNGGIPTIDDFLALFNLSPLKDDDFVISEFVPGTGGEAKLFKTLLQQIAPELLPLKRS